MRLPKNLNNNGSLIRRPKKVVHIPFSILLFSLILEASKKVELDKQQKPKDGGCSNHLNYSSTCLEEAKKTQFKKEKSVEKPAVGQPIPEATKPVEKVDESKVKLKPGEKLPAEAVAEQ